MKRDLGNAIRAELAAELLKFFTEKGEDAALFKSNKLNFPIAREGLDLWITVQWSVSDGGDEGPDAGYNLREQYKIEQRKAADREAKKAIEKLQTLLYNRFVNEKRTTPPSMPAHCRP